jgi:hypothetical protein
VFIVEEPRPSLITLYGAFTYLMGCVAFATYVIHPYLTGRMDINDTSNEWKFAALYILYTVNCFVLYIVVLQPLLGLPPLGFGMFSIENVAVTSAATAYHSYAKRTAALKNN